MDFEVFWFGKHLYVSHVAASCTLQFFETLVIFLGLDYACLVSA